MREYQLLRRLADRADVLLRVATQFLDTDAAGAEHMAGLGIDVAVYPTAGEPAPGVPARVWRQRSPGLRADVETMLRSGVIDLVHVEGYYMTQHLPPQRTVPLVLTEENVEYLLDRRWQEVHGPEPTGARWQDTQALERNAWHGATVCTAVSADDANHMAEASPGLDVRLTPNGADHLGPVLAERRPRTVPDDERPTVGFIGNYSYPPSRDAAHELLDQVWPRVHALVPRARLLLAGAALTPALRRSAEEQAGVELLGEVPDVATVLDRVDVFAAPLRVGGGVKVKVLEAAVRGCPIVTTPVGAQGLDEDLRAAMTVTDNHEEAAESMAALLDDSAHRARVSKELLLAAAALPTWDAAADRLWAVWGEAIATREER
ncbi:glycosyltransferase [Streptomyces sp. RB110-2]|nr:glycosyltransferase [Streptomyces sp. RB110-2]